jgi:putative glycosyl hydrolase-like family 15 (GHL15) protein
MNTPADHTATARRQSIARRALGLGLSLAILTGTGSALAGKKVPHHNLTHNPTFNARTHAWSGYQSKVRQVRSRKAPDGRFAARVSRKGHASSYTIDGNPPAVSASGNAPSIQGAVYKATAWVKGTTSTAGKTVGLVVRETDPSGSLVSDKEATVTLSRRTFKQVSVQYTALRSGDSIDVYVRRATNMTAKDSFLVDAISLVMISQPTQTTPPPSDPPPSDPPPNNPPPANVPVTTGEIAQSFGEEDSLWAEQGSNYRYLIVRDGMHDQIAQLRAQNPGAKILVYKNLSFMNKQPDGCPWSPYQGSGVPYCDALSHESWWLHDSAGNRLESDYKDVYAANIANPGYQQAWIDDVKARLENVNNDGTKYDGVFLDDSNLFPGHGLNGRIAELSDAQYGQAAQSFLDRIGDELGADGFITMPNLGLQVWDSGQRSQAMDIAHHVTAINRETFIRWGEGDIFTTPPSNGTPDWRDELNLEKDIQAAGADYSAIVYGSASDVQTQRYARATFLLGWNGKDGSSLIFRPDESGSSYLPDWTTNVGTPSGERYAVGQGFRRDFSAGTVIINPAPSGSQHFDLGGSYKMPDGSCASSTDLGATKALVLPSC